MISYASIDRIECEQAICELEKIDITQSNSVDFFKKETIMVDIPLADIIKVTGDIQEGDIIVVLHENQNVKEICYKDEVEKKLRIELLKKIIS